MLVKQFETTCRTGEMLWLGANQANFHKMVKKYTKLAKPKGLKYEKKYGKINFGKIRSD
jgi:hypothetical protein